MHARTTAPITHSRHSDASIKGDRTQSRENCSMQQMPSIIHNSQFSHGSSSIEESKRSRWENLISEIKRTSRKYQWRWSQVGSVSTMKRVNQRLCAAQKKKQTRFEVVTGVMVSRGTSELEAGFKLCFNLSTSVESGRHESWRCQERLNCFVMWCGPRTCSFSDTIRTCVSLKMTSASLKVNEKHRFSFKIQKNRL